MTSTDDTGVVTLPAPPENGSRHGLRRVVSVGLVAVLAAALTTTLVAALAGAAGVDFEIADGSETIPLGGFTTVTAVFALVGVVIAVALQRWSDHPARRFVQITVPLTVISLVPPFLAGGSGASASTVTTLVTLHLVAAAVMIPTLARSLHGPTIDRSA